MKITILTLLLSLLLFAQAAGEWPYGTGWTELTSSDASMTLAIKKAAHDYNRPLLLVLSKPNSECPYCRAAWLNALCDGVFSHDENCVPTDETYGDYPIKAWSDEKRVLTAVVKEKTLREALMKNYDVSDYPAVAIVHVKDTADLSSESLTDDEVDVIAAFSFKAGSRVNGVKISSTPKFSEFAAIVETFFPNSQWASMDTVALLNPIPEDGTKTLQNQMFTTETTELWYSFEGVPGKQVGFGGYYATGDTAPVRVGYQLFCGATLVKSGEGDGLTVLDHGFYIQMTESGMHYLRLYATGIEGDKNRFRFVVHTEDTPEQGDITDPYFTGAVLGKWTMDMDAALAAAKANDKDVVVYVGAVTWCPYCMKMERYFIETAAFREWAAENAYLVMVENRRRLNPSYMYGNIYGTSLLVDDSPGGYLEKNGLTLAQGEAKTQENISTTLESLLEPVGSMSDAKPICYPTLIYRRGTDGSIVGYYSNNDGAFTPPAGSAYIVVSSKFANQGEAERFFQFRGLTEDVGENINNYDVETIPSELNSGESPMTDMLIGGIDERDWFGFTVESDLERWVVTANGESAETVRLEVFSVTNDGETDELIASAEGPLSAGAELRWVAANLAGQECRLRVTAPNAAAPVAYSLSWERTADVQTEVSFATSSIELTQHATMAEVSVCPVNYGELSDGMTVGFTLVNEDGLSIVLASDTLSWTAEERAACVPKALQLGLDNAALAAWDGAKTFAVRLAVVDGEGAVVGDVSELQGKVYSKPFFTADGLDMTNLTVNVRSVQTLSFHNGLQGEVSYLAQDASKTRAAEKIVPPEWMTVTVEPGEGAEGVVRIDALPTEVDEGRFTLQLVVKNGDTTTVSEKVTIDYRVSAMDDVNAYGHGHAFAGYFYEPSGANRLVRGRLRLTADDNALLTVSYVSAFGAGNGVSGHWTSSDAATGTLTAEMVDGDTVLLVSVDSEGSIFGQLTSPEGSLELAGGLAAESPSLVDGYFGFLKDSRGTGYAGGALTLSKENDTWSWNVSMPNFNGGDSVVEFMSTATGAAAVVFARDDVRETQFGGVFELKAHPAELPEDYYELYQLTSPDGVLACVSGQEVGMGHIACGTEIYSGSMAAKLAMNTHDFWLTLSPMADVTMAVPVGILLTEDETGNMSGDGGPFGEVSLACDNALGRLMGEVTVYVNDMAGATTVQEALLMLATVPMEQDCCAVDERPVAVGYYTLPDGRSGFAALYGPHNDTLRPNAAPKPLRATDKVLFSDEPVEITADGWLLAIIDDMASLWWNAEPHLLPYGHVSIYGLGDNDGKARVSEPLEELVAGANELLLNTTETPWNRGWNIVAIPWEVSLTPKSKEALLALRPMGFVDGALQRVTEFKAGQAFWVHVNAVPAESLRLVYDTAADVTDESIPDGEWRMAAEPAEWSSGWYWDSLRFKPVEEALPAGVGGWFLK